MLFDIFRHKSTQCLMNKISTTQALVFWERPLAAAAVPFLCGSFLAACLSPLWLAFLIIAAIMTIACFLLHRKRAALFLLCLLCGILHNGIYRTTRPVSPQILDGRTITVEGVVSDCAFKDNTVRCLLRYATLSTGEENVTVKLTMYGVDDLSDGDRIAVRGVCRMEQSGIFDTYRYYYENGIDLFLSGRKILHRQMTGKRSFSTGLAAFRQDCAEKLSSIFSEEDAALLYGVLLGDADGLSDSTADLLNRTGVRHLFVVSGLHISLVAGAVHLLLQKLRFPRRIAALCAIAAAGFLVLLTGCGIPAIRAAIMTTAVYSGRIFFRKSDPLNSLCGAGLLIILAAPYAVTSASFLLSFSATGGLFLLSPILLRLITDRLPLFLRRFSGIFRILVPTFSAGFAVLPLSVVFFGGISLVSPVSNLMAAPLFPIILCSSFFTLTDIPVLSDAAARLCSFCLGLFREGIGLLAKLPFAFLGTRSPFVFFFLLLSAGALLFLWLRRRNTLFCVRLCAVLLLSLPVTLLPLQAFSPFVACTAFTAYSTQVVVLEQGRTADLVIIGDGGSWGDTVLFFLRSRNIRALRSVILLAPNSVSSSSTALITENFSVEHVILYRENTFSEYAEERLALSEAPVLIAENTRCVPASGIDLRREEEGFTLLLRCADKTVCVSDSVPDEESDLLLLSSDTIASLHFSDDMPVFILHAPDSFTASGGRLYSAENGFITAFLTDADKAGVWRY